MIPPASKPSDPGAPGTVHGAQTAYYEEERYYKERKKKSNPMSALSDIMEIFGGE